MAQVTEQTRMAEINTAATQTASTMPTKELVAPPRYPAVPLTDRKLKITVLSGGASTERGSEPEERPGGRRGAAVAGSHRLSGGHQS